MNIQEYRGWLIGGSLSLMLVATAPTLILFIHIPSGSESFSELWLLGQNHKAENYPFNITRNQTYSVFLGIGNHLGYSAYYLVEVKFRNQTQSAPNSFNRTSSDLPALLNITAFVANERNREFPLTFSFDYAYNEALSRVEFSSLRLNDATLEVTNFRTERDLENNGFLCNLFFELWVYDAATSGFWYHERSVGLWFNMTTP